MESRGGDFMRERQKQILRDLLLMEKKVLLVQQLALELNCSEKTIRNDLQVIESFITECSNGRLVRKPGVGISIEIEEHEKQELLSSIQSNSTSERNVLKKEEEMKILFDLLTHESTSLQHLAATYYVSQTTMKKVMDHIEIWLTKKNVKLIKKQKVGIVVEAEEKDIRYALQHIDEYNGEALEIANSFLYHQFAQYEVKIIEQLFSKFIHKYGMPLTDESIKNLILYTLVMIKRTKTRHLMELSDHQFKLITDKKEYQWMLEVVKEIEQSFLMQLPEHEIGYLTMQFIGAKFRGQQDGDYPYDIEVDQQAEQVMEKLTKRISILALVPFYNDAKLKDGLKIHLYSVINRLKYTLPVQNPLVMDIKQMYPFMFDALVNVLQDMKGELPYDIPEDEVAFLTLQYQASMERLKSKQDNLKKIIVVCHMGIGVSEIMRSKIATTFQEIEIVATLPQNKLDDFLMEHSVDLIVSTVPIDELNVPYITVTPLFNEKDKAKLRKMLTMESKTEVENASVLKSYLEEKYTFIHLQLDHRFEIIEKLSERLEYEGLVEADYGHQALLRERAAATAIGGGIAIPHGNPNLVKESKIVIATLKEPITWGTESVSIVLFLALKQESSEKRRRLFHQISRLAGNPAKIAKLTKERDIHSLLSLMD